MKNIYLVRTTFPDWQVWDVCSSSIAAKESLKKLSILNPYLTFEIYKTFMNMYNNSAL